MMHEIYRLLLGILCVWRITHLIQAEDGPWNVIVHARRAAGNGFIGRLLDCFYCLSLWIAAPFAWWLEAGPAEKALLWPALSAGAILLERATGGLQTSTHEQALGLSPGDVDREGRPAEYLEDPPS